MRSTLSPIGAIPSLLATAALASRKLLACSNSASARFLLGVRKSPPDTHNLVPEAFRGAMTPAQVVDLQLKAYNARDIDAFVATYAESARIFDMGNPCPLFAGRRQIHDHYSRNRFTNPELRAEILSRITCGNKVIDLERTTGIQDAPITGPVIYEIDGDLIQNVWFVDPHALALPGASG
ncbi:MAG: nuclear transport factor 2 family protein [Vitreoscilla sp.]